MHRAFSFPIPAERSRTKDRLEASLAGLCELELRRQRQECLVSGALALGGSMPQSPHRSDMACFSNWGQENLTLRRQLSALQNSPWGLMQALEKQVGELRIDPTNESCDPALGDAADSRPSSGFYESSEGHSPKESCEPTDTGSSWAFSGERSTSLGDPLRLSDTQDPRRPLARSFSAPHPPLQGIAEEAWAEESWRWESQTGRSQTPRSSPVEECGVSEEEYQRALRVEGYILGLIQQHTLSPRPCQPRTNLNPDLHSLHRKTPSHTLEPRSDLSATPESQAWGSGLLQGEAPALDEDCYLALPYPHPRPLSLAGGLPPPLPSLHLSCGSGTLHLCHEPQSPGTSPSPQSLPHHTEDLVCAQYIPGHGCHAPLHSPSHYTPDRLKSGLLITSPDRPNQPSKRRASKKSHHSDRQASRKCSNKSRRSQSEHSLLGQHGLPERRYSTADRPQGRKDPADRPTQGIGGTGPRALQHSHNTQLQASNFSERAPICRGERGHARTAPGESESSMSEVSFPASSSSLSSDSDESAGLVWPQQIPPRLAPSSSSSSSSPQASASSQPKAFVKIKASHALKKKILRFRSGSLKVMTTV